MNKLNLLKQFESQIASDFATLTQAALSAREAAIHTESKAEDAYDTRGLEASYLAGAQSKRAMELEQLLNLYRFVDLKAFDTTTPIASTAVIELDCEGKRSLYFLMPQGGGMTTVFESRTVQVITPQSPLGEAILGRKVGDEVEVEIQGSLRDYEIIAVW